MAEIEGNHLNLLSHVSIPVIINGHLRSTKLLGLDSHGGEYKYDSLLECCAL